MITCYFGKTESGKTYRAEKDARKYKRVVVYDNAHCVNDGTVIKDLSVNNLQKLFLDYCGRKNFKLVFRAPRTMPEKQGANRVAAFVFALGSFYKDLSEKTKTDIDRFLFLVDEADKVSTMSPDSAFYRAVTKGRHYYFDCFGIAQGITRLPIYWRTNCSEFNIFRLPETDETRKILGKVGSSKLKELGQYEYFRTKDSSHEVEHLDKNQKVKTRIAIN